MDHPLASCVDVIGLPNDALRPIAGIASLVGLAGVTDLGEALDDAGCVGDTFELTGT